MGRRTRVIYAAGFFDGEGCIQIQAMPRGKNRRGIQYSLRITAVQNNQAPLLLLQGLWGGNIYRKPDRKDAFQWIASPRPAALALSEMLPYLIVKRAEAELALEFQSRKQHNGRRGQTDDQHNEDKLDFEIMRAWKGGQ